jgi:1-phosphofructokinase
VKDKTKTILDADGALLAKGLNASPYMIKPNLHELETAFGRKLTTDSEVISFCQSLLKEYGIQIILVSMGENGSLLITEAAGYQAVPIKVSVKSTVGAGDSMISGMLYGISHGLEPADAFAYAIACGTLAVTKEGTQTFSLEEVNEMLTKVNIVKRY